MPQPNVLVVDDEPRMRELIRIYLKSAFAVSEASDGQSALRLIATDAPNLVLLDVMMPFMDGWTTLRQIRLNSNLPVIMLTARSDISDRVQGLNLGADDYIAKPFNGMELIERIQAVLRRCDMNARRPSAVRAGPLVISVEERTVQVDHQPIALSPKEFDLLLLLALNPGAAFSRDQLLDRVWGLDFDGTYRTVDSHIRNLREKLGNASGMIMTVWGVGYRFQKPCSIQGDPGSAWSGLR